MRIRPRQKPQRPANILILVAMMLVVVVSFMAFTIDFGYIFVGESNLQNAADAGALSGARALRSGHAAAIEAAKLWGGKNVTAGENVVVTDDDVEVGQWDDDTATFTAISEDSSLTANAVRVTCRRTTARGNPLRLFFAPLIGTNNADLKVVAVGAAVMSCGGFVGTEDVDVSGGFTDSYDSSQGSYSSQTPGNKGHVCSNGDITVKVPVRGDASPGTDHHVSIQASGSVSGSTDARTQKDYLPADAGDAEFVNDNALIPSRYWSGDRLSIPTSRKVTFPGGVLYARGVSINGELRIEGPTTLYIEDAALIAGQGLVNSLADPAALTIIMLNQTGRSSTFSGQSDLYATVYGPGADLTIAGNASFFGGIVAARLKLTNSGGCHYDENLKYDVNFLDVVKIVQ